MGKAKNAAKISLTESGEFEIALSSRKLDDIIKNKMRILSLDVSEDSYQALSEENKIALLHLVKAAEILNEVFLKQDHHDNVRAREAFEKAASGNSDVVSKAYTLFKSFNGLEGVDMYAKKSRPLRIFKDKKQPESKGFYPQGLTQGQLVKYLLKHPEQASAILSNNTVVIREDERLKAIPYSIYFREEMEGAASELMKAAKATDHAGLATYLKWQAQALVNDSDPEMVFNAERAWIDLEDSPLEFTIARESYEDQFSDEIANHPQLKKSSKIMESGLKARIYSALEQES